MLSFSRNNSFIHVFGNGRGGGGGTQGLKKKNQPQVVYNFLEPSWHKGNIHGVVTSQQLKVSWTI